MTTNPDGPAPKQERATTGPSIVLSPRTLWLGCAIKELRPLFRAHGLSLPPKIAVGLEALPNDPGIRILGQCWPRTRTVDGIPVIVINERLSATMTVLPVVVHEAIHAAAGDGQKGHGPWFAGWAKALGLVGPPEATRSGPLLFRRLLLIGHKLGPYPSPLIAYRVSAMTGRVIA